MAITLSTHHIVANLLTPSPSLWVPPPLSLYIHFPWCVKKCPYCDFNSHEVKNGFDETRYLTALKNDLIHALPQIWGRRICSIFMGGGTPSLFSAQGIESLLDFIRSVLPFDSQLEITLEANPGASEVSRLADFRSSGITRVSLGIQSFNDAHLCALGRIHGAREAHAAAESIGRVFDRFNLDLMFALPGQTLDDLSADLAAALQYQPRHLSYYQLTMEPNTFFAKQPPANLPNDDCSAEMETVIEETLHAQGLVHYEISAYARVGQEAQHNLNYWQFGDYLGIGAGAHSKLTIQGQIWREMRVKHPEQYQQGVEKISTSQAPHIAEHRQVPMSDLMFEFMLNATRLRSGFATELFAARTGLSLTDLLPRLAVAEQKGLILRDHQSITPTPLGLRFLNDLQSIFLPT